MANNKLPTLDEETEYEPGQFREALNALESPIQRVRLCIVVMRQSLSKPNYPAFVLFWEAKKSALESFKEISTPTVRSALWEEYIELTKEARRLSDLLQEQNAFSLEQIELAVQTLEKDLEEEASRISSMDRITFPKEASTLLDRETTYNNNQLQLNFIHAMASKIQTIRKELISVPTSMKHKGRVLQRLSSLGDQIFPRRKKMIQEMSTLFYEDVQRFISKYFETKATGSKEKSPPLYLLKEEIKAFQKMAKVFSISSECFFSTRKLLGKCFDTIKQREKERRLGYQEKKQKTQQVFESIYQEIQNFGKWISTETFSKKTYSDKLNDLVENIERVPFVHEQLKILRGELEKQKQLAEDKYLQKDSPSILQNGLKREEIAAFLSEYEATLEKVSDISIQELVDLREDVIKKSLTMRFNLEEEMQYQLLLIELQIATIVKQEEACWQIEDVCEKVQKLTDHLHVTFACKEEVKLQLESLRKLNSSSGLNFQQALLCRDCIQKTRDYIEKINDSIEKLEEYLLESQV